MQKFIEVDELIINVETIDRIEFISDDIYRGLFPYKGENEFDVDYIPFTYAKIILCDGKEIELSLDLFWPKDYETEEQWIARNRAYINMSMDRIRKALKNIVTVTGIEYENE